MLQEENVSSWFWLGRASMHQLCSQLCVCSGVTSTQATGANALYTSLSLAVFQAVIWPVYTFEVEKSLNLWEDGPDSYSWCWAAEEFGPLCCRSSPGHSQPQPSSPSHPSSPATGKEEVPREGRHRAALAKLVTVQWRPQTSSPGVWSYLLTALQAQSLFICLSDASPDICMNNHCRSKTLHVT